MLLAVLCSKYSHDALRFILMFSVFKIYFPGFVPGHFMWDLWWIKGHWDRSFSELLGFRLSIFLHNGSPWWYIIWRKNNRPIVLGYLVVIVHAIGINFRGLKPDRRRWILWVIKISSTTSFGGEVKPLAQCRKILQHVKYPCGVRQICFAGKINEHDSPSFPCFTTRYLCWYLPEVSWMNRND
jgi:hypothetical protein